MNALHPRFSQLRDYNENVYECHLLINTDHYQMSLFSHHPFFLPFSCASPHSLFFSPRNSDLSGKPESRPSLYNPTDWVQAYSMSTATVRRPPPSAPLPVEHSVAFSIKVPVKLFPRSPPGFPHRIWPLDGTVALWMTWINGWGASGRPPPFFFRFRSGLRTKVNQMYSTSSHPHFPH